MWWLAVALALDVKCEVCQVLTRKVREEFVKVASTLPKPAAKRRMAAAVAAAEIVDAGQLCSSWKWSEHAGKVGAKGEVLAKECARQVDAYSDALEGVASHGDAKAEVSDEAARGAFCLKKRGKRALCAALWTEEEKPENRLSKEEKEARANDEQQGAFLAANRARAGVVELPSGLQYKTLQEGTGGAQPTLTDKLQLHYRGTLADCAVQDGPVACEGGTQFDASYDRGQPFETALTGVVKGWQEVVQEMTVGQSVEAYIPWKLAYGERGSAPKIGPKQLLVFKIELLKIFDSEKKDAEDL